MQDKFGYDYDHDARYCRADSNVLKNKLGITDADDLRNAEREITSMWILRLKTEPVKGRFDFIHLKHIHRRIFSDIYTWAGKSRVVDISKGNVFCRAMYIETYASELFSKLADEKYLVTAEKERLPERLAFYLSEINAIHPFREGNGRTQRLFLEYLGSVSGVHIDFSRVGADEMVRASAHAFAGELKPLCDMLKRICTPLSIQEQEENIAYFFGERSGTMRMWKSFIRENKH